VDERPVERGKFRFRDVIAGALLALVLLGAFVLQVYDIDKHASTYDDRRMMESALLLVEGYHPYFGLNYAMPSIWLWAMALNGRALIRYWPEIENAFRSGNLEGATSAFGKSRREAYLYPDRVTNRLRWVQALATVGVVLMAYLIAVRLSDSRAAGLVAASICAVSPLIVELGTDFHSDQFQAFGAAACLYFSLGEAYRKGRYQWLAAALFCSIGIASKFIAAPFWVSMILAIWLGGGRRLNRAVIGRVVAASVVMFAFYLILAPYMVVDAAHFLKRLLLLFGYYYQGESGYGFSSGLFVLFRGFRDGLGYGASALAAVGLAWALRRRFEGAVVLLSGILFYCLLLSSSQNISSRYAFTLVPLGAVMAGVALVAISRSVPLRASVPVAIMLFAASLPLPGAMRVLQKRANGDTQTLARQWIVDNVPAGSRVFVGWAGPHLHSDRDSIRRWRSYYANLLVEERPQPFTASKIASPEKSAAGGRAPGFNSEFFREAMLHEEKYFYKMFCYLNKVKELPQPGYDYIPSLARNDPGILSCAETYWVVDTHDIRDRKSAPGLYALLQEQVRSRGKLMASFPDRDMMGLSLLIYRVDARPRSDH